MASLPSAQLQALHIALTSHYVTNCARLTATRVCAGLRPPVVVRGPPLNLQRPSPRRHAACQVIEAGQAGEAFHSSGTVVNLGGTGSSSGSSFSGGGGSSTGTPAWQGVVAALGRRQPDVAWREFMLVLEQGVLPPNALCDELINALCVARRFQEAWRAYAAITPAGYSLQYNTYQALISQALKVGDLDAAMDTFRNLQSLGLSPNQVTYCGLISALGKAGQRQRGMRYAQTAYELWQELLASATQLDAAAYRTGIKACVDVGHLREADKLLQRMAAAGMPPDVRAYNILLAGHSRAANTAAMGRLLQRMAAGGVQLSSVTYNTLVDGYVRARDLEAAKAVVARAAAAGVPLDVWTYSTLIKGYVQAGKLAAAEGVLGDMAAAGIKPSCVTFSTLVDGHVRAGDMAAARRVLEAMLAAGERPNAVTYNSLLRGYAARAAGSGGSGAPSADGATAASAAGGSGAEAGSGSGGAAAASSPSPLMVALGLLRDMQAQGVSPTVQTFNTLMAAAVAAEDCQLALELHQRLRAAGLRPDALTFTSLIQAYGRLGQVAEAAATFEALLRDRSAQADLQAYNAMVDALARNGDMAAAERMLDAACEVASKQGAPPPVEAYGAVVAGYARQLAVGPAVAAVKRFHAAGGSPDAPMLDILANIAIRAGDYKVAMQAVRALELIGREVDKAKYAALLEEVRQRQAERGSGSDADRPQHNRTWAEYQRRREARQRNVQLERFKFWLGLPNRYYSSDSADECASSSGEEDEWGERRRRQQRQ